MLEWDVRVKVKRDGEFPVALREHHEAQVFLSGVFVQIADNQSDLL
jgi:hypothetical protein